MKTLVILAVLLGLTFAYGPANFSNCDIYGEVWLPTNATVLSEPQIDQYLQVQACGEAQESTIIQSYLVNQYLNSVQSFDPEVTLGQSVAAGESFCLTANIWITSPINNLQVEITTFNGGVSGCVLVIVA